MQRLLGIASGVLATIAIVGPVAATAPQRQVFNFETDPYVLAECDGYDVVEQLTVYSVVDSYFDANGGWVRDVVHSTTTGTDWRSDTGLQIASFSDAGGTFTARSNNTFTWTGNHSTWTTTDGRVFRNVGRVVVAEVAPGEFERIFAAGNLRDIDPCDF